MSLSASTAAVCFIACHGGPADHFATFAQNLSIDIGSIKVYASGPALKKFRDRGIEVRVEFSTDKISPTEEDVLAEEIAKSCSSASVIITDVGHPFDIKVQKALARHATYVPRFAYYDNPESYVPGGYSETAAEVMLAANGILFANSNLAKASIFQQPGQEIDFGSRKKVGIGYYPIHQAEKIAKRRTEQQLSMRQTLFFNNGLVDTGQKVLVYFGGNNDEYFSKAFPAFLSLLEGGMKQADFTNVVIVIQQHPGAKGKNIDGKRIAEWIGTQGKTRGAPTMILSDFSSDEAQIIADAALYYQTSMGPQFVLVGIPTIQVGHETFEDILVRNRLAPSVTDVGQFISAVDGVTSQRKEIPREVILEALGIKQDWLPTLEKAIQANSEVVSKQSFSSRAFQGKKPYWPYYLAVGGIVLIGWVAARFFKAL
jgi:hypothetical protein